jgi:hypothetical protein
MRSAEATRRHAKDRTMTAPQRNLLDRETSPYLLQHRGNPVHWRPWGPEALAEARAANKPVLLSVGYAACHWCHVMAHESFEDPETAAVMNELFVNIKVDREERPDIDTIYQSALALLGENGGWPLTMFLTADGEPFWGGTYFPPEPSYGRPGFRDVLRRVAEVYRSEPATIATNRAALMDALAKLGLPQGAAPALSVAALDGIAQRLEREIDRVNGGIGGAPKFPNPTILELLWRAWRRSGTASCRDAVMLTLDRMSQGGIYDHLGGGYARYATDVRWLVPHFEKMLYDNAQLLELLALAWADTAKPLYAERARETVGWLLREMVAEGGAFAATQDADSEGEEGRFYVWDEAEIDALLGPRAARFKAAYDVRAGGNWEDRTILNRLQRPEPGSADEEAALAADRALLFGAREKRVKPGWDDKVLADWNGLMIKALAEAAMIFGEPGWLAAAERAFAFVSRHMSEDGRLKHSYRAGRLKHAGLLDDHANMARAAIVLLEATGDPAYLAEAEAWADVLDRHYWDAAHGGYFLTADDAEALIIRTRSCADHATPAGNAVALGVLARLWHLTGRERYRERADALVAGFAGELTRNFFPLAGFLNAFELYRNAAQVVLVGDAGDAATAALRRAAFAAGHPDRIVATVPPGAELPASHPAHGKGMAGGRPAAYVCIGATCTLPLTDPAALTATLRGR